MSSGDRAHIVIIEDNSSDIRLFELALAEAEIDCDLTVISDGGDALSWAIACDGESGHMSRPDLAVVDLNLPKYSGLEILSKIRCAAALSGLPVLVLSSSASPRDVARVAAFSDTAYMTKPLDLDQYIEIGKLVRRMLEGRPHG